MKAEEDCLEISDTQAAQDLASPANFLPTITLPTAQLQTISPGALAYLGDAVYELYIRSQYLLPPKRLQSYHQRVVAQVRAESQAHHLRSLVSLLTGEELEILRRGRNAASSRSKRVNPEIYQQATSLEALMGYLYLTNPQRLAYLLAQLKLDPTLEE
ncbi:Mini-ribonuclease 3 [Trichocoleus sp. FACHB-591]|uniref:Mini-ribonuclease 3 n=1 Tax=Trichocoleus sp. FACHB-591 TaxID=2692872 RepID=UPI001688433F|nr:Mini-ribonuclease 3 [Trichocoleus sp. FACHB-591]